ncbi:phosphopantetheine-binding protein, partial [Streptomyces sp. NPDC050546]|uniref:phosphopantetheine-binding protein n=1 Tax=Streptomyces sp. NPDC050546 TaxID=3365628 RepID=UPI0037BD6E49
LDYLGRLDHQIKIRGQRIEPAEIDTALQTHPDVLHAITTVHVSADGTTHLAAYYTAPDGAEPPAAPDLRAHLRNRLPAAMVPAHLTHLPELPQLPNGKVDRKRLPAPGGQTGGLPKVAPRTAEEFVVAEIWSEVLGVRDLGVQDDFYDVGGDSLRAIQVCQLLSDTGSPVPLPFLLGNHTVEQLAARLGAGAETDAVGDGPASPDAPALAR